jgi:hypothetical protein
MLSPFEHFASRDAGIDAHLVSERIPAPRRLSPSEWTKAIFEHWKSQQSASSKSTSEEAFAEATGLSRGGVRKLFDSDRRPRFDTIEKLKKIAPAHLKNPDAVQDPDLSTMSDPDHSVSPVTPTEGEYVVNTHDGQFVGRQLDEIEDRALRRRARNAALAAIEEERSKAHPSELGADRGPGRVQRR